MKTYFVHNKIGKLAFLGIWLEKHYFQTQPKEVCDTTPLSNTYTNCCRAKVQYFVVTRKTHIHLNYWKSGHLTLQNLNEHHAERGL